MTMPLQGTLWSTPLASRSRDVSIVPAAVSSTTRRRMTDTGFNAGRPGAAPAQVRRRSCWHRCGEPRPHERGQRDVECAETEREGHRRPGRVAGDGTTHQLSDRCRDEVTLATMDVTVGDPSGCLPAGTVKLKMTADGARILWYGPSKQPVMEGPARRAGDG
ncbi:hypothetical protein GCM10027610_083230 [Dactylosporangium cerinum]